MNLQTLCLHLLEAPDAICAMDSCPQFICMLPCRSLARYASTSKEKLSTILHSFHIVSHEIGLFQHDPQQWEFLAQSKRQRCFIQDVLHLIQASHRLSNYKALWHVVPCSASPGQVVQAKEKVQGWRAFDTFCECRVYDTPYHASLSIEDKKRIEWMNLQTLSLQLLQAP